MNLEASLSEINHLILNGKLTEAGKRLSSILTTTNTEKRMKAHFQAIIEFHRGSIPEAYRLMLKALEDFGENVNLIRDIVVCQYHLQDMQAFRATLGRLEVLLIENESSLCERSLIECELMVGKFLEEEARLAPAAQFYDRAFKRADQPLHRLRALIQKARWQALYEPTHELSNHYRELISFPRERLVQDLSVELEHSLMLIELRLIGADHAWQRIERVSPNILPIDKRLLVFDYVEGVLSQDHALTPAVLKKVSEFEDLDPFETFLKDIVKETLEHQQLLGELTSLASKLPWASYLRLLCIAANLEENSAIRTELHRKIQLILRALDPRSQALWAQRLKQALQTPEIRMDFSSRNRSITIQGKIVDLSKKKIGLLLLEKLVTKPSISVDEAIDLLWQNSFSPEHYHRLRMSIHRLNTLIHETAGLGKVIEVDAQTVRLRPEVKLRPVEDGFDFGLISL